MLLRLALCQTLVLPLFLSRLYGQNTGRLSESADGPALTSRPGNASIVKTQGANRFQNIHCGLQDKNGLLWFGTTGEGVYRYDGSAFYQFTKGDGLSGNTVWSLLEDSSGHIWCGTDNGVSVFDGRSFSDVSVKSDLPFGVSGNIGAVWSLMQDRTGTIWIGADSAVYCFDGKSLLPFPGNRHIRNPSKLSLRSVQCLFQDKTGRIWFGSGPQAGEGIAYLQTDSLINLRPGNETWIRAIRQDTDSAVFFASRHNGILEYDRGVFSNLPLPDAVAKDQLTCLFFDGVGNLWFGVDYKKDSDFSTGGLWRFDGNRFQEFAARDGLSNNTVTAIFGDRSGNIWVGTRNMELFRFDGKNFIKR